MGYSQRSTLGIWRIRGGISICQVSWFTNEWSLKLCRRRRSSYIKRIILVIVSDVVWYISCSLITTYFARLIKYEHFLLNLAWRLTVLRKNWPGNYTLWPWMSLLHWYKNVDAAEADFSEIPTVILVGRMLDSYQTHEAQELQLMVVATAIHSITVRIISTHQLWIMLMGKLAHQIWWTCKNIKISLPFGYVKFVHLI